MYRIAAAVTLLLSGLAAADSITVAGKTYPNVYIREGGSLYYVQMPEDGTVLVVPKAQAAASAVSLSNDIAERERLLARWKEANARLNGRVAESVKAPSASKTVISDPSTNQRSESPVLRLKGQAGSTQSPSNTPGATDGVLPHIKLNDVKLADALKVILRQLNLDYTVQGNVIYISTPERLRKETWEQLETRVYHLNNAGDTMPKIVVRSSGLSQTMGGVGGAGGYAGGAAYGGTGYGGYGGVSANQYGGSTMSGGYGGNSYGGGMMPGGYGGAGGGYGRDVTQISNISDLFSRIDDRMVGETPAQIGG
jgi:hypothetical protein